MLMKIAIDASRYKNSEATGVEWYSWHIINAIMQELFAAYDDDLILYSREPLLVNDKVENRVVKARRLWTLWVLSREIGRRKPDVLFVPSHTLPLKLAKWSVITIHDVAFKYLRSSYSFFQYHYLNWSTKFAVKNANKIIVPSQATADDLVEFFDCPREKIVHIDHGFEAPSEVNDDIFSKSEVFKYFGLESGSKYILFLGRLESKKNLVRLVEAFSKFSEKHADFRLVLAGKRGVGFADILKKVNELSVMHKVVMPGYVNEEEKAALYKYCNMFAFCSLYEGFGLPILEAFHYEKPVIASNVSSMPEVGGEAVLYVDPYDVESIAEGLEILAANDEYVKELVRMGVERLKKFSWHKAAKETLKVLHGQ